MFDLSTVYMLIKILMLFVLFMIGKIVYEFVYIPYRYRAIYGKYKNVKMTDKFYPFLGDIRLVMQNEQNNESKFHHFFEESLQNEGKDIRLFNLGSKTALEVISTKAMDELEKLVPSKIDRDDLIGSPLENVL